MTSVTQYKVLILIKDKTSNNFVDKTHEVSSYEKTRTGYTLIFRSNSKPYQFNFERVLVLTNPKVVNIEGALVSVSSRKINNIEIMMDFEMYYKIFFSNKKAEIHRKNDVKIEYSCLVEPKIQDLKQYLVAISNASNQSDDQDSFLSKQLDKIKFISRESVFADYSLGKTVEPIKNNEVLVFPFGLNKSQKIAVEKAMTNKISIIQGPPGTGKTQTILNIIANIVNRNMNVAVVSGNNSATQNVYEKLQKYGYDFFAAPLGNTENQKHFFDALKNEKIDLSKWAQSDNDVDQIKKEAIKSLVYLNEQLELINERAMIKEKLSKLRLEQKHYNVSSSEFNLNVNLDFDVRKFVPVNKWKSETLLKFIATLESMSMASDKASFLDRLKLFFEFRFTKINLDEQELNLLVLKLHQLYYEKAISECIERLKEIKSKLKSSNFEKLMDDYQKQSEILMKNALYKRYHDMESQSFDTGTFKKDYDSFLKQFPVILSTTHSIRRNIPEGRNFDYLIIDEASQVDLVTATLSMSCCKHLVIVGDPMQLPHIVNANVTMLNSTYMDRYHIAPEYDYTKFSIIESLVEVYGDRVPMTMLQEHYRCHPQIIRFCNEKYYDNQLVIMTNELEEDEVLSIFKTAPGNHERPHPDGGFINLRQMEVIRDEILPTLEFDTKEIGIVTPYRQQANETKVLIGKSDILVETVHKFQGREKDAIIISTVKSEPDEFIDDKKMINVAVSRSVKKLIVVVGSDFKALHGSNIGDLIKYIEYTGDSENIKQSSKVSIFDCLYSEYEKSLIPLMKKKVHVSEFDSENLMATLIESVLKLEPFNALKSAMHVSLGYLIKDHGVFEEHEKQFIHHPFSHADFVIFNKLNKEPLLVVEVDGYKYHHKGTKQYERDRLKDGIFEKAGIKMIRFATNGSTEKERLMEGLRACLSEE